MSNLIKFFTRGKYNHAAIQLSDGSIYEATTGDGVRKIGEGDLNLEYNNYVIDYYGAEVGQEDELRAFLEKQLGKKYDYWMVFGFVIYKTSEDRKSSERWFCSELVLASLNKIGYRLFNCEPWKISPEFLSYSTKIEFEKSVEIKK
jgi:hypothetical protein